MSKFVSFLKTSVVSVGMLTDSYEVFLMNMVSVILSDIYGKTSYSSTLTTTVLIGMALGQLIFGFLGDAIGRKPMFIVTAIFLIFFSVASAFVFPIIFAAPYVGLSIIRFFLGLGIGGEYPLSSTITAESSTKSTRGKKMVFIFTMRGIGNLIAPVVVMVLLYIPMNLDYVWRVAFALGAIPCLLTLYFRFSLDFPNKAHTTNKQKINLKKVLVHNWKPLLGTAGTWFLFDIAFYGNSMSNASILQIIGFAGGESSNAEDQRASLITNSIGNIILTSVAFPGFIVAYFVINRINKKWLQMGGFFGTALCEIFICGDIRGLSFFFQNLGPNTMTYILSTEVYDSKIRATFSGLSAASGKVGAMIGTAIFNPFAERFGVGNTFYFCAALMIVGIFFTLFIPSKSSFEDEQNPEEKSLKEKEIELSGVATPTEMNTETKDYAFSPASPADTLKQSSSDVDKIFAPIVRKELITPSPPSDVKAQTKQPLILANCQTPSSEEEKK
ncbi:inorganic phosphate transporter, putative [Entamoeba invadens IP1]|uniref:inorganic phosphate transporter, putative n=1 Tax=Entamoeba invadens IP1 TaxID=370355 RepID=UPI0002C3EC04|nr:inorganic phosphate transporter, putative [Entamoeba invadens IP1]ELP90746.1 inorganic phosphate transporter, putative [Entamoeba invadens IP1]|eukprot:XP_004257517.1 inorganic phosphate transporter, putative [Entamoeba invadens IP1]